MDVVDHAVAVLAFGMEDAMRHVHRTWCIAYWKVGKRLYCSAVLAETDPPPFLRAGFAHFEHNRVFLEQCCRRALVAPESLRFPKDDPAASTMYAELCIESANASVFARLLATCQIKHDEMVGYFKLACANGALTVVKYLHREVGLTVDDRRAADNKAMHLASLYGHVSVIERLHREMGLTADDCRALRNYAMRRASENGHVAVVEYLHSQVGLTADDCRADDNHAMRWASENGHVAVVEYLHREVGLTADDCRALDNEAMRRASKNGHVAVVEYLHREVGLTADDCRALDNYAMRCASRKGHVAVVAYLRDVQ